MADHSAIECGAMPWGGDPSDWPMPECTHPEHWLSLAHDDPWLDWDDAPARCRSMQVEQPCELEVGHGGPHLWPALKIRLDVLFPEPRRELAHA